MKCANCIEIMEVTKFRKADVLFINVPVNKCVKCYHKNYDFRVQLIIEHYVKQMNDEVEVDFEEIKKAYALYTIEELLGQSILQ